MPMVAASGGDGDQMVCVHRACTVTIVVSRSSGSIRMLQRPAARSFALGPGGEREKQSRPGGRARTLSSVSPCVVH
jgi:hypothetical protein